MNKCLIFASFLIILTMLEPSLAPARDPPTSLLLLSLERSSMEGDFAQIFGSVFHSLFNLHMHDHNRIHSHGSREDKDIHGLMVKS